MQTGLFRFPFLLSLFLAFSFVSVSVSYADSPPVVVYLTQTPCVIVEAEVNPQSYVSRSSADCKRINKESAGKRVFTELRLKPGKVVFRVTNKNVPYDLGFWLRGQGIKRLTLPGVSGGGLKTGATKDYTVVLTPGKYLYSCPLNPTPNYPLVVTPN